MIPKKRIRVCVKLDGSVIVAPEGFAGAKCKSATRALEKALGMTAKVERTAAWSIAEAEVAKVASKR